MSGAHPFRMLARVPDDVRRDMPHMMKTFPGKRAFIPSNPVKRETVPCYAASERQAEMSLTPSSDGQRAGFRLAGSRDVNDRRGGATTTGLWPACGTSGGVAVWAPARRSPAGRPEEETSARTRTQR